MPYSVTRRALRPCSQPACPELVRGGGLCHDHARNRQTVRGSAHARGYDRQWRQTAANYLQHHALRNAAGEPICEECGASAAEVGAPLHVDHIDGQGPTGPRGHDPTNLQALCPSCHARKTRAQTG